MAAGASGAAEMTGWPMLRDAGNGAYVNGIVCRHR